MRTAIAAFLCAATAFVAAADSLPKEAPPFTVLRSGGPPIQLSQYRGKIVALILISTSCPHCQALTTTLLPIAREYTPKGVQFIECAVNPGADQLVPAFVQQFQPPFPVGWTTDPAVRSFLSFSVMSPTMYVPHLVFLDRKGVIQSDYPGESTAFFQNPGTSIRAELDKMLKAEAPSPAAKNATSSATKK